MLPERGKLSNFARGKNHACKTRRRRPGSRIRKRITQERSDTSWEKSSDWYDGLVGKSGSDLHREIILPRALALMGAKNKSVLDIGCGQGVYSRALAEAGARVTGIDASPALIEAARRYQSKVPVKYECENAEDLRAFADQSFDQVSAILCIQNMRNLDRVTSECARVLRPNGRMLWVLNHPCFRIPRQTSWGFDEGKKMQYRRIDMYMSPAEIPIQMHPGKQGTESTVSFHRSITDLFSIASRFSFAAVKVEEWSSTRSSQPGPRAKAENRARKEFPLFMAVLFQLVG